MSVYRRGIVYHYEFQIDNRIYRGSTGCRNEREARAVERQKREEAERGTADVQIMAGHTVREVFDRYWQNHARKLSWADGIKAHMIGLEDFFRPDALFETIGNAEVAAALEAFAAETTRKNVDGSLRPGQPTDSTVNRRLAVLRGIYNKARVEWEYPVKTIAWKAHVRKEPRERVRHITVEQAKGVLVRLPPHIQLMAAWSLTTGCRLNETETLEWPRVNYETLQAEVYTKGGGTRFVDLGPDAVQILALCDRSHRYVFDSTNRRKLWEAAVEATGLGDFHWHDLRHTFATWLGQRGAGLHVIMKACGHTKIETTMKYLHVIRSDVKAAVAEMPTLIESAVMPLKNKPDAL